MTTPHPRSLVSAVAALAVTIALGACASAPARGAGGEPGATARPALFIQFDNDARDYVHVYLIGAKREWVLGRVAPGARAALRIPDEALSGDLFSLQLAALVGERVTLNAAALPRTAVTIAQPAAAILANRWTFSHMSTAGQLVGLPLRGTRAEVGRP